MNERLFQIREAVKLSQQEFGGRIGVSRFSISNYEAGTRNVTERVITDVCREFLVSETWLRTGDGDMFKQDKNSELNRLARENNLDALSYKIIESYMRLNKEQQRTIKRFIIDMAEQETAEEISPLPAQNPLTIDEQVELYRARLIARGKKQA